MSKREVAMRLKAHLRFCYCRDSDEDKAAARELRALLAVARAAERACPTTCGYKIGTFSHDEDCAIGRALARLRSASAPGSRKRTGGGR